MLYTSVMTKIEMFSKASCVYCDRAKNLFNQKGVEFTVYNVLEEEHMLEMQRRAPDARTVPQIFIADELIGGFSDLDALDKAGSLDPMLAK